MQLITKGHAILRVIPIFMIRIFMFQKIRITRKMKGSGLVENMLFTVKFGVVCNAIKTKYIVEIHLAS